MKLENAGLFYLKDVDARFNHSDFPRYEVRSNRHTTFSVIEAKAAPSPIQKVIKAETLEILNFTDVKKSGPVCKFLCICIIDPSYFNI